MAKARATKRSRAQYDATPSAGNTVDVLDERDKAARKLMEAGHPKLLRKGTISLQSESHPVEFRKVELLPLKG